jgi:phospholipid/cholesterol/gamma-HCH transport system substrate-binding protein
MARRRRMTETIVGIFVLASVLLLLVLVVFIGRQQNIFQQRYEIDGYFNSVGGLQTGADVQLAGITVGHVKSIRFGTQNRVQVVMSITQNQRDRIRSDSVASIRTFGLMGDRYVAITVGSGDEPIIPPGGTIKTQETIELSDAVEAARPTLENIENTMQNISNLTDRLANPESDVATILKNVKVMTTNIREGQGTIGALVQRDDLYQKTVEILDSTKESMDNFKATTSNVQKASVDLPALMKNIGSSAQQIEGFSTKAAAAAAEIYQFVGDGGEIMGDAKTVVSNLKSASEDIKDATPKFGPLIESADSGVNDLKEVVDAAKKSWLIRGPVERPAPEGPIIVGERDVARPEVIQ